MASPNLVLPPHLPVEEGSMKQNNMTFRTLCLKELNEHIDDEALKKMCEMYGKLQKYKVMRHENGSSKGYGFVMFKKAEDAEMAVDEFPFATLFPTPENISDMDNVQELVQWERVNRIGGKLHVSNLDLATTNKQLREMFQKYGRVLSARVAKHGGNMKYGFVQFSNYNEAVEAIIAVNGLKVGSRELLVSFASDQVDKEAAFGLKYFEKLFDDGEFIVGKLPEQPSEPSASENPPNQLLLNTDMSDQRGITVSVNTTGSRSVKMAANQASTDGDEYSVLQRALVLEDPSFWCGK